VSPVPRKGKLPVGRLLAFSDDRITTPCAVAAVSVPRRSKAGPARVSERVADHGRDRDVAVVAAGWDARDRDDLTDREIVRSQGRGG